MYIYNFFFHFRVVVNRTKAKKPVAMIYIYIFFWLNIMFILQYIVCLMEHDSLIYYPKRPKKKKEAT